MKLNNKSANNSSKSNAKLIVENWAPTITKTTGVTDPEKLEWMSQLAHNTAKSLNEDAFQLGNNGFSNFGGTFQPYNNLYNTLGVGDAVPAGKPAMTSGDFASSVNNGSGDKYPALLPLALKVAAKTIGFDLVNTTPLAGPTGVLPYLDYVYSGSKQPFGATPAYSAGSANPATFNQQTTQGYNAFSLYGLPHAFKASIDLSSSAEGTTMVEFKKANRIPSGTKMAAGDDLIVEFIGYSRIDGDAMFKVIGGKQSLGDTFQGGSVELSVVDQESEVKDLKLSIKGPKLISMLEDQILGFAGSGERDTDPWTGTFQDGTVLYDPMSRGTGEMTAPRQISLTVCTKNVTVGTIMVGCAVTQEQVTDLQKQWNIDVIKMVENAGINELSTTINKHITSRLFGLGWKNHVKLVEVEGPAANLNLTFTAVASGDTPLQTPAFAMPNGIQTDTASDYSSYTNVSLPFRPFVVNEGAVFENRDTLIKRIYTNILAASNWIQQRGRYGAATFVVTNNTVATLLQSNAHYAFSPIENTVSQSAGQLYPIGTVCGLTVYVDPLMAAYDTRVLVGRKGAKDEPGVHFCPYVMAEVVRIISEGTGAPKLYIKSRYALVDAGFFPETQYLTFMVDTRGL